MLSFLRSYHWFISLPIVSLITLFISIALTTLTRRLYPRYEHQIEKEIHIKTIDIIGLMLGLLMGFAVLVSQNWYSSAEDAIQNESVLIQNALRNADFLNEVNRKEIYEAYKSYIHYLIDQELDEFSHEKKVSVHPKSYIKKIEAAYLNIPVNSLKEKVLFSENLKNLDLINNRQASIEQFSTSSLHPVTWMLILFFSGLLIFYILTYPIKNAFYCYILHYTYILVIFFLLYFLYLLELPFTGDIIVDTSSLRDILKTEYPGE